MKANRMIATPAAVTLLVATCWLVGCERAEPVGEQRAVVDRYCIDCHNDAEAAGNLALEHRDLASAAVDPEVWEKASASCAQA